MRSGGTPLTLAFDNLMAQLAPNGARVATPGGQAAFDVFLSVGYAGFHLSRATRAALPGGRGLFSVCDRGVSADAALAGAGLVAGMTNDDRPAGRDCANRLETGRLKSVIASAAKQSMLPLPPALLIKIKRGLQRKHGLLT